MKRIYIQLKNSAIFLLIFVLSFSFVTSLSGKTVYAVESNDAYITYNKNLYDKYKDLCDRLADGIKNFDAEIYIGDFKITSKEDMRYIMKTVIRKHPELFYVDASQYMMGSDGTYIAVICPIYPTDKQTAQNQIKAFNSKVSQYLDKIDDSMSEFEKAVVLHDELALNCKYLDDGSSGHISAYDAIVNGSANCQGYSSAYSYLLSLVGVHSEIVESSAMYHIWNKVRIDGKYYNVDLTWDDAMPDKYGHVMHKYFLFSDSAILNSDDEISQHYGLDYEYYKSTDTRFDKCLFREFDTKFCFVGQDCYVIDNKYSSRYERCLLKYNTKTDTAEVVKRFDYRWKSGETSYWKGGYMSLEDYDGLLYLNASDRIYVYDPSADSVNVFSDLDTSAGDCYGMHIVDGEVYAAVSATPNDKYVLLNAGKCIANNPIVIGDVVEDGVINILDVTLIQKYSAGLDSLTDRQLVAADFSGDGIINVTDATAIQKYIVNL